VRARVQPGLELGRHRGSKAAGETRQGKARRVQQQARCRRPAVQTIARDRSTDVRQLRAKLVGAPGLGAELDERPIAAARQHSVVGDRFLPAPRHDARRVSGLRLEPVLETPSARQRALGAERHGRDVDALDRMRLDISGYRPVQLGTSREREDAGRPLVETLMNAQVFALPTLTQPQREPLNHVIRESFVPSVNGDPARLVDDQQVAVVTEDARFTPGA
jgi:hypothetical protein